MATANSTAFNNAVSVTPSEVKAALRLVGTEYPELCRSMEIAEKMILRLQTCINEAGFHLDFAESHKDIPDSARKSIQNVRTCLGSRDQRETFNLDCSRDGRGNVYAGELVESEAQHA